MKKLLIICFIFLFCGCFEKKENVSLTTTTTTTTTKPSYIDDNPIKLGFYLYTNSYTDRNLINNYEKIWESDTDIGSFEVFFTNEKNIPGSTFQTLWMNYFNLYSNIDKYRIGYHIKFSTSDGNNIDQNILRPSDADNFFSYLQIYMYDDVHQEIGKWYSHVTNDEFNSNTLLSSIKLTNSITTDKINSDIELSVFTYDDYDDFDDFNVNNYYRGNSIYKINIKRKNSN